jgi:hypothetical protein
MQQGKHPRLASDPAHLLYRGDVEVEGELAGVGEEEVGAERQVERTVTEAEVR